jgi:hypothetical protein
MLRNRVGPLFYEAVDVVPVRTSSAGGANKTESKSGGGALDAMLQKSRPAPGPAVKSLSSVMPPVKTAAQLFAERQTKYDSLLNDYLKESKAKTAAVASGGSSHGKNTNNNSTNADEDDDYVYDYYYLASDGSTRTLPSNEVKHGGGESATTSSSSSINVAMDTSAAVTQTATMTKTATATATAASASSALVLLDASTRLLVLSDPFGDDSADEYNDDSGGAASHDSSDSNCEDHYGNDYPDEDEYDNEGDDDDNDSWGISVGRHNSGGSGAYRDYDRGSLELYSGDDQDSNDEDEDTDGKLDPESVRHESLRIQFMRRRKQQQQQQQMQLQGISSSSSSNDPSGIEQEAMHNLRMAREEDRQIRVLRKQMNCVDISSDEDYDDDLM